MDRIFDELARNAATAVTRRQLIGRVASGLFAALMASVAVSAADRGDCGELCVACCKNLDIPPRDGVAFAECIRECHEGGGLCGPIVCPNW